LATTSCGGLGIKEVLGFEQSRLWEMDLENQMCEFNIFSLGESIYVAGA